MFVLGQIELEHPVLKYLYRQKKLSETIYGSTVQNLQLVDIHTCDYNYTCHLHNLDHFYSDSPADIPER